MIVSARRLTRPQLMLRRPVALLPCQSFNFARKVGIDDTMESLDDIMKQMQRDLSLDVTKEVVDDGLVPRVTQQKEDVVYIKNPASNWGFHRILKFANHDASALTISL